MTLSYTHEISRLIQYLESTNPKELRSAERQELVRLKTVLDKLVFESYTA